MIFGEEDREGFAADLLAGEEEGEIVGFDVGFWADGLGGWDEDRAIDLLAGFFRYGEEVADVCVMSHDRSNL